jgi:hypothetical protein
MVGDLGVLRNLRQRLRISDSRAHEEQVTSLILYENSGTVITIGVRVDPD